MHIGQIIRALREEKGWTQEVLALEAGMATIYVSRIERGERRLPTTRLENLAAALGTTASDIYAIAEGRAPTMPVTAEDGDSAIDYSEEAVQLRRLFRGLTEDDRRLVVDFTKMLLRRHAAPQT
jgi:transcriptional regulator with XRE-family HTH domain